METKEQEPTINQQNPQDKPVAFFAGRANPPTPGHIKIMIQMLEFASNNGMIPRIYLSSSFNKDKKDITHITNDGSSSLREAPYYTHVKHKKYENPLTPEEKKYFVVEMLFNATNANDISISKADLEEIVVVTRQCQPLYFALSCVSALQPDKDKQYYFMGKEKDEGEAMRREKDCKLISLDNGAEYYVTNNISGRYKCILVSREDDTNNSASGMSGSKIRLLVASEESVENDNTAKEAFQNVYNGLLSPEQSAEMFDKIKQGMLFSSQREGEGEEQINYSKRSLKGDIETGDISRIRTSGGRKTKRNRKTKRKKRTKKRKTKAHRKKRKKTKRKVRKNLKKRTKKR